MISESISERARSYLDRTKQGLLRTKSYVIENGIPLTALVVGLGVTIWSGKRVFVDIPQQRNEVVSSNRECAGLNLNYEQVKKRTEELFKERYTLAALAQTPEFRQPIECYRSSRDILEYQGLGPDGSAQSLATSAFVIGLFGTCGMATYLSRHNLA